MENIHFGTGTLVGYVVAGVLMVLLPVVLLIVWKQKTKASIVPAVTGAVTFFAFALVLEQIPAALLLVVDSPVSQAINASVWLKCLVGGLLAGVFEETGRLVAFRCFLKKYNTKQSAVTYGIGHGGVESLILGVSMLSYMILGILVNSGNLSLVVQGLEGEQLALAMEQLQAFALQSFGTSMLAVSERASAMLLHLGLSVLVFRSVHSRKSRGLFWLAVLLHALFDFTTVLYVAKLVPLLAFEMIMLAMAATVFVCAYRIVYRRMPEVVTE